MYIINNLKEKKRLEPFTKKNCKKQINQILELTTGLIKKMSKYFAKPKTIGGKCKG